MKLEKSEIENMKLRMEIQEMRKAAENTNQKNINKE